MELRSESDHILPTPKTRLMQLVSFPINEGHEQAIKDWLADPRFHEKYIYDIQQLLAHVISDMTHSEIVVLCVPDAKCAIGDRMSFSVSASKCQLRPMDVS